MRVRLRQGLQAALRALARHVPSFVRLSGSGLAFVACAATHSTATPPHACACQPVVITDACLHLKGGPAGHAPNTDLGKAHALVRYFGVGTDPIAADTRLADALDAKVDYRPIESCAASAETDALGSVSVTMQNEIAVVRPGTGDYPKIPVEAKAIAVDVTALPETEASREAVHRVLRAVIHESVALPAVEYRKCNGQPDEFAGDHAHGKRVEQYRCVRVEEKPMLHGHGPALPIAVVVAPRLTPVAAWTAAMLRGARDALIVGADIPMKIAESRWVGLGQNGIAIRVARFPSLPDVLTADAPDLAHVDWKGPRVRPPPKFDRAPIADLQVVSEALNIGSREGDYRAALIVAYAATHTFFPYQEELRALSMNNHHETYNLDTRLDEALTYLASDRASALKALRRYGQALVDGHHYVWDPTHREPFSGPLRLASAKGGLAVSQSASPLVKAGDVILAIGDQTFSQWVEDGLRFKSGTYGLLAPELGYSIPAAVPLRIRTMAGEEKTVTIPPNFPRLPTPVRKEPKSPGLLYIDLSKVTVEEHVTAIQESLKTARGVLLDMRGYPTRESWKVMGKICSPESRGPQMAELAVTPFTNERGPWEAPQTFRAWGAASGSEPFAGPVVMLIGPHTQSQAEHLVTFFRSQNRGKLIGQRTSGANGTITGVRLPGGFGFTFTGMYVRHPDGKPFHAQGHVPDLEVLPTLDDLAHERDAVLLRGVEELQTAMSTSKVGATLPAP